jgi:hypothetical protein
MSSVSDRRRSQPTHQRDKEKVPAATASDRLGEPGEVERLKVYQCSDYAEFTSVSSLRSGGGLTRVAVDGTSLRAA